MTEAKIEELLLQLTADVNVVKGRLGVIDDIKEAIDNVNIVKTEIEILKTTVTSLEAEVTKLKDKVSEEERYRSRSVIKTIFTVIATIVSAIFVDYIIK